MKFEIHFEIFPQGVFGLPERNRVVFPSGNEPIDGDTFHRKTNIKVGYGTLPKYRNPAEAINLIFTEENNSLNIFDNFILAKIEANSVEDAHQKASKFVNALLQNLSVSQSRLFSAKALFIESEDGNIYRIPSYKTIASVTTYNLTQLRSDFISAIKYLDLNDERLHKSLQYFEHALLLYEKRNEIGDPLSDHNRLFITSIFLNVWKSISSIVGDPSIKSDRYQSRYKKIGLPENFKKELEKVKKLRDNYDVAHYNLIQSSIEEVEKNYGYAIKVAVEVIKTYRDHLARINQTKNGI